jgi:hypothetical protein
MSKALRSIKNDDEKQKVIARRLKEKAGGLGYLAAVDATKYNHISSQEKE